MAHTLPHDDRSARRCCCRVVMQSLLKLFHLLRRQFSRCGLDQVGR
jgi:hypothetical protein